MDRAPQPSGGAAQPAEGCGQCPVLMPPGGRGRQVTRATPHDSTALAAGRTRLGSSRPRRLPPLFVPSLSDWSSTAPGITPAAASAPVAPIGSSRGRTPCRFEPAAACTAPARSCRAASLSARSRRSKASSTPSGSGPPTWVNSARSARLCRRSSAARISRRARRASASGTPASAASDVQPGVRQLVGAGQAQRLPERAAPSHRVAAHQPRALGVGQRERLVVGPDVLEREGRLVPPGPLMCSGPQL